MIPSKVLDKFFSPVPCFCQMAIFPALFYPLDFVLFARENQSTLKVGQPTEFRVRFEKRNVEIQTVDKVAFF